MQFYFSKKVRHIQEECARLQKMMEVSTAFQYSSASEFHKFNQNSNGKEELWKYGSGQQSSSKSTWIFKFWESIFHIRLNVQDLMFYRNFSDLPKLENILRGFP